MFYLNKRRGHSIRWILLIVEGTLGLENENHTFNTTFVPSYFTYMFMHMQMLLQVVESSLTRLLIIRRDHPLWADRQRLHQAGVSLSEDGRGGRGAGWGGGELPGRGAGGRGGGDGQRHSAGLLLHPLDTTGVTHTNTVTHVFKSYLNDSALSFFIMQNNILKL